MQSVWEEKKEGWEEQVKRVPESNTQLRYFLRKQSTSFMARERAKLLIINPVEEEEKVSFFVRPSSKISTVLKIKFEMVIIDEEEEEEVDVSWLSRLQSWGDSSV